ncbi:hypothetical protein FUA23_02585 [Neolewinella aurantiaca]|uniref:Uncharacterized protein n=1 Tax=Neolewinella aurantiaca TaxID=2602767 RepID=A0A5C7FWQ7_9BACT|nr:hypothetical protein [Neolewinella aurantiaca]TXF91134.1 hypothetical protein FUA23_02585 [Neolewinella aurantiaca]
MINKNSISELGEIIMNPETAHFQINSKYKKNDVLVGYLNGVNTIELVNKEESYLSRIEEILDLDNFEKRWDYIEFEFGGNLIENPNYGWVTLRNYHPNIVVNKETKEFYLEYLLDSKLQLTHKIDLLDLKKILFYWKNIISNFLNDN